MNEKGNPPYPINNQPDHPSAPGIYPHAAPPPSYDQSYYQQQHPPGFVPPPQQHAGFVQPQHPQQPPIMYQPQVTHTIYVNPQVGPDPCSIACPSCHKHVVTRLEYETATKTHVWALILCAFACWPCAWIPYVMDSCKNANHYCPSCGAYIGKYDS